MSIEFKDFVIYDDTSPTFLRWCVDVYSGKGYHILEMAKGDTAGSLISSHSYAQVKIQKKLYLCHRVIWELHNGEIPEGMFIDHLDGVRLNNNITNLRVTTRQGNSRNCKIRKDNTSGITGVNLVIDRYKSGNVNTYWCANYFENGTSKAKRFSVSFHGDEEAKRLASDFRLQKETELNLDGVPFTERHGK